LRSVSAEVGREGRLVLGYDDYWSQFNNRGLLRSFMAEIREAGMRTQRVQSGRTGASGSGEKTWPVMKLSTIALDFDGTIARNDVLDPDVRQAIAEARAQRIVVVLVTGRILEDLRRVAGDLHFADAVVAENGAVIEFPDSGYSRVLGQPPPAALLNELQREGIPFAAGQSIIDASTDTAHRLLTILQRLELPLALAFNRSRVMVLPQAISKATGLKAALTILRLSPHNAVSIGDAENDHELLQSCEVGVAVGWGSEALKASADYVLPGDGPAAVAGYIRELLKSRLIPEPLKTRRHVLLGHTGDGHPLTLAIRGRNLLVAGDSKTGKSWVTGSLCEQLILYGYSLCILDPEGDYTSLEALPGVVVLGGADPLPRPRDFLRLLRHADVSIVVDLSHTPHQEMLDYLQSVLPALATLKRHTGLPHKIIVDEAHYILDEPHVRRLSELDLSGYALVTYRASKLRSDLLATCQAIIVTRESDPQEVHALRALCQSSGSPASESEWQQLFDNLVVGEAVILPITEEAEGRVRRIRLTPRLTPHVRHLAKYIDLPVSEGRAFIFWGNDGPTGQRAQTLREFVSVVEQLPAAALDGHLRRRDFSRWIAEVFGDYPLAKTLRQIEDHYVDDQMSDVESSVVQAIRQRYDLIGAV
jgi:hydroxymethylpyrimidine pyrophosphatase-like HAD family hydrolase